MKKYSVGNGIYIKNKWEFNQDVSKKFDIHIRKSVPLYEEGHQLIIDLIEYYVNTYQKKELIISDLGCSTGILIKKISQHFKNLSITFYGIDKEQSMLKIARKRKYSKNHKIYWITSSLENYTMKKSDIIICYYVLQFIPLKNRQKVVNTIYKSLYKNGFFFLFEKINFKKITKENINNYVLKKFKLRKGFSLEEILNKEKSLKGILIPMSLEENFNLINNAGFKNYNIIMQWGSFYGFFIKK